MLGSSVKEKKFHAYQRRYGRGSMSLRGLFHCPVHMKEAQREEIQSLLDSNQVEEAKAVQEKKALVETLYTPYPTWPFRFRSKIFSTVLGVSGSLLLGLMTAALQQYLLPALLQSLFHHP